MITSFVLCIQVKLEGGIYMTFIAGKSSLATGKIIIFVVISLGFTFVDPWLNRFPVAFKVQFTPRPGR